jgi:PAS domain S-box-containing protein
LIDGADVVHIPDMAAIDDPMARVVTVEGGIRTLLRVALRKDGRLLGQIVAARKEVRPFADKEIALLQGFAAQAVIAIENARLINETREALDQQTATAEVLQVINSSPGDLAPVFDTVLERAMRLCGAAFGHLDTYDGRGFHTAATRGVPARFAEYRSRNPSSYGPGTGPARMLAGEQIIHNLDLKEEDIYRNGEPNRRALVDLGGARSALQVALRKDETFLGFITLFRQEVRPFTDKQGALLQNFAAQAVIAMENARLLTEQGEALERQTATAEVLEVINSSPGNLQPVFDAMLDRTVRLSESAFGIMNLYEEGGYKAVALHGVSPGMIEQWSAAPPPGPENALTRLIDGEDMIHIEDLATYPSYLQRDLRSRALVDIGGARSLLAVALRKDGKLLGSLTAYRQEVRPFSQKQIELLEGFAAQAVIAMENARLLSELRTTLERQTATAEVLRIISSSPGRLEPVFEAVLTNAVRISRGTFGMLALADGDGFRGVATYAVGAEYSTALSRIHDPPAATGLDQLRKTHRTIEIADCVAEPAYDRVRALNPAFASVRTALHIPMLKDTELVGAILVYRDKVTPFQQDEIELVENFAQQAVIATENARLLEELRDRQAELRVTFDNMGDGVAMFDDDRRLAAWNRNFQEIMDLSEEWLSGRPTYAAYLGLLAERGEFGTDNVEAELASRLEDTERELRLERIRADGSVIEVRRNAVPGGGFVLIYSDVTQRRRAEEAIRQARDVAETALKELKTAQASLIHAEKMASLGQLTAGIAHEIKNPLNFVNNFAGLSMELLDELKETVVPLRESLDADGRTELDETMALLNTNLDKIRNHGRRADGIVRSMLLHSRGGSSDHQVVDINAVLEEAVNLAYHGARAQDQNFNVTLERDLQSDIAPIEIVPQDVTRVFLNLIGNGFYAVDKRRRQEGEAFRPTVKVTTHDLPDAVEIAIRDNGVGIPAQHRQRLFQPFFTTKPTGEGTGLGLSISYDIVTQQHGGTIEVESAPGSFTEFTVRLPRRRRAA